MLCDKFMCVPPFEDAGDLKWTSSSNLGPTRIPHLNESGLLRCFRYLRVQIIQSLHTGFSDAAKMITGLTKSWIGSVARI